MNNKKRSSNRQTQASSENQNLQFNHIKNIPFCFPASSPRAGTVYSLQPKQPSYPMKHLNDKNQLSFVMLRKVLILLKQNTQYIAVGSHNPDRSPFWHQRRGAEMTRHHVPPFGLENRGISNIFYNEKPNASPLITRLGFGTGQSFSTPETAHTKKETAKTKNCSDRTFWSPPAHPQNTR